MAGRRKPTTTESDISTTNPTEEVTMSTTTEDVTETPDTVTEDAVTETPAVEETPIDLAAFEAALAAALVSDGVDEATGTLPDGEVSKVVVEYQKLEGAKAKAAARGHVEESMKDAMTAGEFLKARGFLQVRDNLKSGGTKGATKAPKAPADPTEAFVSSISALLLAGSFAQADVPEGVSETWADQVQANVNEAYPAVVEYAAWLDSDAEDKGDAPEVPAFAIAAVKLARGKAVKGGSKPRSEYSGPQRDVAKHIESAFEGVESGTFLTIAEIRGHKSAEYGDDQPSAGAISARLFPRSGKVTIEGVVPGENDKGTKGAAKA